MKLSRILLLSAFLLPFQTNAMEFLDDERPNEHISITLQVMKDPVVAADEHSHEKIAILGELLIKEREAEAERQRIQAQRVEEEQKKTAEEKCLAEIRLSIPSFPLIAHGYEEIYQRFLGGKLIYRPQEGSDVGRIEMPISALQNPLEGTFDLSQCGDTGKYLNISTGYRKEKRPENVNKVEIWFAPRFLIEQELQTTASHFQGIMGNWYDTAPVGIFWTWGRWNNLSDYDYLVTLTMNDFYSDNLYKMRTQAEQNRADDGSGCRGVRNGSLFHVSFVVN